MQEAHLIPQTKNFDKEIHLTSSSEQHGQDKGDTSCLYKIRLRLCKCWVENTNIVPYEVYS